MVRKNPYTGEELRAKIRAMESASDSAVNNDFESFLAGEATETPEPRLADNDGEDPQALTIPIDLDKLLGALP